LEFVEVVPYTVACAEASGRIRAALRYEGLPIGPYDILIAGTAIAQDLVLVTSNSAEFERVDQLKSKDWRLPLKNPIE
jgi:tRNA(fMet)-specific endonuclease VapC